jgi:hypothetical protein
VQCPGTEQIGDCGGLTGTHVKKSGELLKNLEIKVIFADKRALC